MLKFPLIGENSKKLILPKFTIADNNNHTQVFNSNNKLDAAYNSRGYFATIKNDLGRPLRKAASEGNVLETKLLLSKGAVFTADWLGTSPIHLAAQNNHTEICELLLQAGINKNARTKVDRTPLHVAACEGHCDVVEALLSYGADTSCKDLLGMTPLHWSAQNGHYEVVKVLLKHKADSLVVNKFDLMPADLATQINRQDIVDLINASVNSTIMETENLALELATGSESTSESIINPIPLETVLMEDNEDSIESGTIHLSEVESQENESSKENLNTEIETNSFDESMKILEEHGIRMIPHDEHDNILSTVMETGHSVVLTDVGKEMLNFVKESEERVTIKPVRSVPTKQKKFITVTPQELMNLATNGRITKTKIFKSTATNSKSMSNFIIKNNTIFPVTNINSVDKATDSNDMKTVMKELVQARRTIKTMTVKLRKKEQEVEWYKQQLKLYKGER